MGVLHLGHLFLKSAQVHGKSWKIGAFDVDPEAFHIHLAPFRSSPVILNPETKNQVTRAL